MSSTPFRFPAAKPRVFERHCRIVATGVALPPTVVTNADLLATYGNGITDAAIRKTWGVEERRVAAPGTADSDWLCLAAESCLQRAGIAPERLSKLMVTKFLGDRLLPMTASLLQKKLRCPTAVQSFDIDGGVNSFLQAFDLASCAINSGDDHVLIVSGGILHRVVGRRDPRTAFLYGDGAGAVLLAPSKTPHVEASYFFSNHRYADLGRGFAFREVAASCRKPGEDSDCYHLYRPGNWKAARQFVLEACEVTVARLLEATGASLGDIDLFLITENNRRLWLAILERLGVGQERTLSLLAKYGNTMSAMLPLLLDQALQSGRVREGQRIVLLSIGEGISGGGLMYRV